MVNCCGELAKEHANLPLPLQHAGVAPVQVSYQASLVISEWLVQRLDQLIGSWLLQLFLLN